MGTDEQKDEQIKGLVILIILHTLLVMLLWSLFKTSMTSAGNV